jgi:hypothetical protein
VSREQGLPLQWSDSENVNWKTELGGFGASCPVILGNRIFITWYKGFGEGQEKPGRAEELVRVAACFDDTGNLLWSREFPTQGKDANYSGRLTDHGYASSTPATDGERLYVFFGTSGVYALDLADGRQLWRAVVGNGTDGWGSASSPIVFGDLLLVNASIESGSLLAFNKATGKEAWRASGIRRAWNTPVLVTAPDGTTEVVISTPRQVRGIDPRSGDDLWRCDGIDDYICPSVCASEGIVYALGGRGRPGLAVRSGGRGDVTDTHQLWTTKGNSNVPSPVVVGEHLYWVSHDGTANCVSLETGEIVKSARLRADRVYASTIAADGRLYAVTRGSGTYVLSATPELETLAHNRFESDSSIFNATPAVANGCLYLRSDRFLYCLKEE